MAAKKKNADGLAFLIDILKQDRNATYADAKAAADKKKLKVWPIMWGKAKLMLGHVKAGAGATKKAQAKRGPGRPPMAVRRGPGRPPKARAVAFEGLDGIIAAVRSSQQDLVRFRAAIEKIQGVIQAVVD